MKNICYAILCFAFFCSLQLQAQFAPLKAKRDSSRFRLGISEIPTINLNPNEIIDKELDKIIKKKKKKNIFYGERTKRYFTKTIKGRNITIEKLSVLREYSSPSRLVYYKYYYDINKAGAKRKIVKTRYLSKKYGLPLHGVYERFVNGEIVEKGYFYYGMKHGRWEKYNKDGLLIDKKKWFRGFPKDSRISYYDGAKTKIKEVIPIHHGIKEGMYLKFYESGNLAKSGRFKEDVKYRSWFEYYDKKSRRNKRREIQHRKKVYDDAFKSYIKREWNEKGKQIKK